MEKDTVIPLGSNKQVTVRAYRGANLVDIREFYTDKNGELKPGKKGISLTVDVWRKLVEHTAEINKALEKMQGSQESKEKPEKARERAQDDTEDADEGEPRVKKQARLDIQREAN